MFWKHDTFKSRLFSEKTFYAQFFKDLNNCKQEVIIESPYITASRIEILIPTFQRLLDKNRKITIVTRDPSEQQEEYLKHQSTNEILHCSEIGINLVLEKGFHHRKIAIIDRQILWEGSLNILSHSSSKEIMRRIEGEGLAKEMFNFLQLNKLIKLDVLIQ